MIEQKACYITGHHRGLGAGIADDEPSHIHLPRRRRLVRRDDQGTSTTLGAHGSDEMYRGQTQSASKEA
jgi:hypothetical protein